MQVEGIMQATDLPPDRAQASLQRSCTEPLLWKDAQEKLPDFRSALEAARLSLTRGGRFWHVAGQTNKGTAMQEVLKRENQASEAPAVSLAIGDSPIDQGMLDLADYPIAIPAPDGTVQVNVPAPRGRRATLPGPAGWAETVTSVLDELLPGNSC
jgi:mannosyl-3-phosphoglycerate phosphatase